MLIRTNTVIHFNNELIMSTRFEACAIAMAAIHLQQLHSLHQLGLFLQFIHTEKNVEDIWLDRQAELSFHIFTNKRRHEKTYFFICENKGADQLRCSCEAH